MTAKVIRGEWHISANCLSLHDFNQSTPAFKAGRRHKLVTSLSKSVSMIEVNMARKNCTRPRMRFHKLTKLQGCRVRRELAHKVLIGHEN
jgi:hypothetical protein